MSNMDARKSDNSGKKRKGSGRRRGRPHPIIRILSFIGSVIGLLFTMVLIGCITGLILVGIFMTYVNTSLKPDLYVDDSEYVLKQSSILYYMDAETGNWTELQKLHGTENRVLVEYEDIPKYLIDAAIAHMFRGRLSVCAVLREIDCGYALWLVLSWGKDELVEGK